MVGVCAKGRQGARWEAKVQVAGWEVHPVGASTAGARVQTNNNKAARTATNNQHGAGWGWGKARRRNGERE